MEIETLPIADAANGEVGSPGDTSPIDKDFSSPSPYIRNKKLNKSEAWFFDIDGTRRMINKLRSRMKVKFAQKKKKD